MPGPGRRTGAPRPGRPAHRPQKRVESRYQRSQAAEEVLFDCATSGPQQHRFEGPLLREVVLDAHPLFDVRRRKDRSRFVLAVSGGDGHRTVLAWAEIDAGFGDAPVLLATRLDGRELDTAGSRLVVPVDRCGARYVSAITHVWVGGWPVPA
ncbi:molybdopterin-dependent oxidoreductase [Streptomyces sp. NBC_01174]|uniref:molybdopterin-dependent oxidoreductase n=1 Tax=Streptomyces sp. NBC_01174 TaxID=2903758 RepID=UPI003865F9AC